MKISFMKKRILLADDDAGVRQMLGRVLESEHYEVVIEGALEPRGLTLRATDAMNNVATAQVDAPRAR